MTNHNHAGTSFPGAPHTSGPEASARPRGAREGVEATPADGVSASGDARDGLGFGREARHAGSIAVTRKATP